MDRSFLLLLFLVAAVAQFATGSQNGTDVCNPNPCKHEGNCTYTATGSFKCICTNGFVGERCMYPVMTGDPVLISQYNSKKNFIVQKNGSEALTFSDSFATGFKMVEALSGETGAVSFKHMRADGNLYYVRAFSTGDVGLEKQVLDPTFNQDASFYPRKATDYRDGYIFITSASNSGDTHEALTQGESGDLRLTSMLGPQCVFYITDMDSKDTLKMYSAADYTGYNAVLTADDSDFNNHAFDNKLVSFEITGKSAWLLYEHDNYQGESVFVEPGKYNEDWLTKHFRTNCVSSARLVNKWDGVITWDSDDRTGHPSQSSWTLTYDTDDFRRGSGSFGSIQVIGPSSWEVYSGKKYTGNKAVAIAGYYDGAWIKEHLSGATRIQSLRKVPINQAQCSAGSGKQKIAGKSGKMHDVFVVHRYDGSVWYRFGEGDMSDSWTYYNEYEANFNATLISPSEIETIKDFDFLNWEVDTDINVKMSLDNSWHPSKMSVMYPGSKYQEILKFMNVHSELTTIEMSENKLKLVCTGKVLNNAVKDNLCGRGGLPEAGRTSRILITAVDMQPQGLKAYATGQDFSRNAYCFKGSHYYVYAKIADCAQGTGCYSRESNSRRTSLSGARTAAAPNHFYFGQYKNDVDGCEAACRAEPECYAYTLFQTGKFKGDVEYEGGCYGVSKQMVTTGVPTEGAISGVSVTCGSSIPEYMDRDFWTKNTTGCACEYDSERMDCACCEESACQCDHRHKYQCVLCGREERCGSPLLNTEDGKYLFEYTGVRIDGHGRHFSLPSMCVSECDVDVRAHGYDASSASVFFTNVNDKSVLTCTASGLDKSKDDVVSTTGVTMDPVGARFNKINLFATGGTTRLLKLKLKISKTGCPEEKIDPRYVGCFNPFDYQLKTAMPDLPTMESTHMTHHLCVGRCFKMGHQYALLTAGTTCICSNKIPDKGKAQSCINLCSGDPNNICGGERSYSIFKARAISSLMISDADRCVSPYGKTYGDFKVGKSSGVWCEPHLADPTTGYFKGSYIAKSGTCTHPSASSTYIRTQKAPCEVLGGQGYFAYDEQFALCRVETCPRSPKQAENTAITFDVVTGYCPPGTRVGKAQFDSTAEVCDGIGGDAQIRNETGQPIVDTCVLQLCSSKAQEKSEDYVEPITNQKFSNGSKSVIQLNKEMCVDELELHVQGHSPAHASLRVALLDADNEEVGLTCTIEVNGTGIRKEGLCFADKPTGLKGTALRIQAAGDAVTVSEMRLHLGECPEDVDMVVLYEQPNFGGRPKVVKDDLTDLSAIDFDNKVMSYKIFGKDSWEFFEDKNLKGSSTVVKPGKYYTTETLPFGDRKLSSLSKVGTLNQNFNQIRKEISNKKGLVCFKHKAKSNSVWGLGSSEAGSENRPRIFYFGTLGDDVHGCERACRDEPQCAAWTLFSSRVGGMLVPWRGMCYGRSFRDETQITEEDVISGYVAPCTEEDSIVLYSGKEYSGVSMMITEDSVNVTFSVGPMSAVVTGKDTWRVFTESDGHMHTYKLSPGEYPDVTTSFVGEVVMVSKMNPNTQLFDNIQNHIDLAPVAQNQIQKTITKTETKTEVKGETKTVCNTTEKADIMFVVDSSSSIGDNNYPKVLQFMVDIANSFNINGDGVRVGVILYSQRVHYDIPLGHHTDVGSLDAALKQIRYYKGGTYTHEALKVLRNEALTEANLRKSVSRQAIVITDGRSRKTSWTKEEAQKCRDAGIVMTAVGVYRANDQELINIAGDASRKFYLKNFDDLASLVPDIKKTTCTAVHMGETVTNITEHVTITVQGNDGDYFLHKHNEFIKKPVPLGMESGVIFNSQIFASSALHGHEAWFGRLNGPSGWITTTGNHTVKHEWIEIDLGQILPIHGLATQGHNIKEYWVTKYKVAISLDGIHFVTFKDGTDDLIFIGNHDHNTTKYHCLHRLFGKPIQARVIRFIVIEWHIRISMRIELYGYREPGDLQVLEILKKDVWTKKTTGCPCYFDPAKTDCACCEDGGCQCPSSDRHQCVQCGSPHNCGTLNPRNPVDNIDGWTKTMSGCPCAFDPLRTDCACCQNYGCQCGSGNKNQCVNCGHPEHCGQKENIFGPNPYCKPYTCPRKIKTIWEVDVSGVNPGTSNPTIVEA